MGKFNTYTEATTLDATDIFLLSKNGTGTRYITKANLQTALGGSIWTDNGSLLFNTTNRNAQIKGDTTSLGSSTFATRNAANTLLFEVLDNAKLKLSSEVFAEMINTSTNKNAGIFNNALSSSITGTQNYWFGHLTFETLTTGNRNQAWGLAALRKLTTGNDNIGIGQGTGDAITTGLRNVFLGNFSGGNLDIATSDNTFIGYSTGGSAKLNNSVLLGKSAGGNYASAGSATGVICIGEQSGDAANGDYNMFIGQFSGTGWLGGVKNYNMFLGYESGRQADSEYTLSMGYRSGYSCNSDNSVFLGRDSGYHETANNTLMITNQQGSGVADARSKALILGNMEATTTNQWAKVNGVLKIKSFTAAEGSALTGANGDIIYVSTTDATFTSVGFWGYQAGAWAKL